MAIVTRASVERRQRLTAFERLRDSLRRDMIDRLGDACVDDSHTLPATANAPPMRATAQVETLAQLGGNPRWMAAAYVTIVILEGECRSQHQLLRLAASHGDARKREGRAKSRAGVAICG